MSWHAGMRMNADASATYTKLQDGSWGVWTDREDARPGKSITVTTLAGSTKLEKLKARIGTSKDGTRSLWTIESSDVGSGRLF